MSENTAADATLQAAIGGQIAFADVDAGDTPEASVDASAAALTYTPEGGAPAALPAGLDEAAIKAAFSIDAAGAWAPGVGTLAAAAIPVQPMRHQLAITPPLPGFRPEEPIVRVVDAAAYVRPCRGGLMWGGFEADPLPMEPIGPADDFTMERTPLAAAASAASVIATASSTELASGFSQSTCLPASSAAIAISAWVSPGVQMSTRSTSSRSITARHDVSVPSQPSRAAAASTFTGSRPASTASRGVIGRSKKRCALRQAWEWAAPMKA